MVTDFSSRGSALRTGDILEGRYRIVRTLGAGAMSSVYLAEHVLIKRRVAVKLLRPEFAGDAAAVERFLTEARTAGTLGHSNLVECTDLGSTGERVPYLVFEYLEGALLTDEIYRVGGLPVRRALQIADQIAAGLEAAHRAGVVHGGLTSDGVFLIGRPALEVVKLLDFGVARLFGAPGGPAAGAPEFMAPEQLTRPDAVDHRADVYALGVILYEMLTARRPFGDEDRRSLVHRVVHEPPPPLMRPEAPPGLEQLIVSRLLAKDPARRCAAMADVRAALEVFSTAMRPTGPRSSEIASEIAGEIPAVRPAAIPQATAPLPVVLPPPVVLPLPAETVALPVPASRSSFRLAWLVAALLAGATGGGVLYVENQARAAADHGVATALDGDAEKLASLIDGEVRAAHLRADAIAAMPMLRAAIETDAATLQDMADSELLFSPRPGEVLELFQLHDGSPSSMLRIPATAAPIAPLPPLAGNRTRLANDGRTITIVVGAPIIKQQAGVGGAVAIAMPLDLAPIRKRLAEHARAATLIGLGPPLPLLGTGGDSAAAGPTVISVALGPDLGAGEVAVSAVATPPADLRDGLRLARLVCWGIGAMLLALFIANLLRGGKPE
ncbi:MAG TPA: serine/threonine-protein kinase [Kofleriaceae bacterium]